MGIARLTILMPLKALGIIQKQGNLKYELKSRNLARKAFFHNCSNGRNGKGFCIVSLLVIKVDTRIQNEKSHGVSPAMHQHSRQSRIPIVLSLCSVFVGISRMLCITSCFNLTKPSQEIGIDFN